MEIFGSETLTNMPIKNNRSNKGCIFTSLAVLAIICGGLYGQRSYHVRINLCNRATYPIKANLVSYDGPDPQFKIEPGQCQRVGAPEGGQMFEYILIQPNVSNPLPAIIDIRVNQNEGDIYIQYPEEKPVWPPRHSKSAHLRRETSQTVKPLVKTVGHDNLQP